MSTTVTKAARTLEQRVKCDSGLGAGRHLIYVQQDDGMRRALCDISPSGIVRMLIQPQPDDAYSAWYRVTGDSASSIGCAVIVWREHDPALRAMFDSMPVATISLYGPGGPS